jgi:cellobiose phosphorylase
MVSLLLTSLLVLILLAIALYFWQKTATPPKSEALPAAPGRALFHEGTPTGIALAAADAEARVVAEAARQRQQLLENAHAGAKATLIEAQAAGADAYEEVLKVLVDNANSEGALLSLASYISRNNLRINNSLAEKFIESHSQALGRGTVAEMLHIAALSDDASVFQKGLQLALKAWRAGTLPDVSAQELQAILEGEFWILSPSTRSSGAGFLLKRELASARRELSAAHRE